MRLQHVLCVAVLTCCSALAVEKRAATPTLAPRAEHEDVTAHPSSHSAAGPDEHGPSKSDEHGPTKTLGHSAPKTTRTLPACAS
jgi:hypothetical protein